MPELHKFVFDMYMLECERIQQEMIEKTNALQPPPTTTQPTIIEEVEEVTEEQLINFEVKPDDTAFEPEVGQVEHIAEYENDDDKADDGDHDSDMEEADLKPPGEE